MADSPEPPPLLVVTSSFMLSLAGCFDSTISEGNTGSDDDKSRDKHWGGGDVLGWNFTIKTLGDIAQQMVLIHCFFVSLNQVFLLSDLGKSVTRRSLVQIPALGGQFRCWALERGP